ncbi:hypothetical protein AMTR_s00047p00091130 [Amborella trichopoda]|uniref:Uncharacterized protein n=1 Tax=Amborella trichopoda TaxID=13333 RepID=U5D5N2_AMBTC|nr:hypothetical protein AMTR_s00047p00091130 [Amborella trichopoda]
MKRQLRTAYLSEGRTSDGEVASLRAERDSVARERDSIAEDLKSLRWEFEGMREAKDMAVAEHDSIRKELERVRAELKRARSVMTSSIVVPTLPEPSPILIGDLDRRLVRKDVVLDRYRMERVRPRLEEEGESGARTPVVEEDSGSRM